MRILRNLETPLSFRKKINVILDLDNTLIFSIEHSKYPKRKSILHEKPHYFMDNDYVIYERPDLQDFLDWLHTHFNVMIWSAASPEYVEFIVENILQRGNRKYEYVLTSNNCEDCQDYFGEDQFKNLRYLWDIHDLPGYGPFNTLIVDDLKMVSKTQPNNSIQIKSFNTNHKECWKDNELMNAIKPKLEEILESYEKNIENEESFVLVK
jgi:TFIIF-interacting CTD phosphatase-like protein